MERLAAVKMGAPGEAYDPAAPTTHTKSPIVTGTSVVGIKYRDGIMMAADTLGSYGGLARFKDLRRVRTVGEYTLVGAGGEYSDFQYIMDFLQRQVVNDVCMDDGSTLDPENIHSLLTRVMYQRRNKGDPLWNSLLVAGVKGESGAFLGYVDSIGTAYHADFIATGFGSHLAMPVLRTHWKPDMTEDEARQLLEISLRTLYYRDCRTLNRITFGRVTAEGPVVDDPVCLDTKWDYKLFVQPKAGGDNDGSW